MGFWFNIVNKYVPKVIINMKQLFSLRHASLNIVAIVLVKMSTTAYESLEAAPFSLIMRIRLTDTPSLSIKI